MPTQTFTTGQGWWTVPINVSTVVVECWGGGGNGGGDIYNKGGGGGGGGAYAKRTFKLYQGHSYLYSVGNAQYGSDFRKADTGTANRCTADAGGPGSEYGGSGGSAAECEGDVCYSGGNGGDGYVGYGAGGGGGGAAGDANNGGIGGNGTISVGGAGGVGGINGGGNGGTGSSVNPVAGSAPGGGGGGGHVGQSGASGAKGQVKLTWTVDTNVVLMNSILE